MKIAIDARWIFPQITGIGSYTQELIRQLVALDRENEYTLYFQSPEVETRTANYIRMADAPNVRSQVIPYGPFALRSQLAMPRMMAREGFDVYHSTNFMYPFAAFPRHRKGRTACVLTIHDLIPLIFPEHTPRALKTRFFTLYRAVMREVGRRADLIITVSDSSRRDIIQHMHIPEDRTDRIVPIPEGVAEHYQPATKRPTDHKTILYVGRMDPYKNVVKLIEAFERVYRGPVPEARLRIIGPRDERYPEAEQRIQELNLSDAVMWGGYVSGDELLQAYQQADVFVLPSLYEGFGLPVLEAMACGIPVICSNLASLPEVAGDAALLINSNDPNELDQALINVLTQPDRAESMRIKSLNRAAQFTWQRTAEETLRAYEQAARLT